MSRSRSPRRRPEKTTSPTASTIHRTSPWLLLFAALSLALAGAGTFAVLDSSLLRVQSLRVEGAETLDVALLAELTGLRGRSMLDLPEAAARARLLDVPQVRAVSIERRWPQGVTIRVQERQPWAIWSLGGALYPIDVEGVVLAAGLPPGDPLMIHEPDSDRVLSAGDRVPPEAISLATRLISETPRSIGRDVCRIEYRPGLGITVEFTEGLRVTFGDERGYAFKVAVLANLLDQLSARGESPESVDLRFGARVTYE